MENFIIPIMNVLQVGYILLILYSIFNKSKCSRQKLADLYFISCVIAGFVLIMELSCGFFFGAIGIIFSALANSAYKSGNIVDAQEKNRTAKIMTIISLVINGLGLLLTLIIIILYISFGLILRMEKDSGVRRSSSR